MIQVYDDRYKQDVVDLILYVQNVEHGLGMGIEDQSDVLDIDKNYMSGGGGFWIALNEYGKFIGSIGLQRKDSNVGVLKRFFVHEEYRGKEHGVGASLFNSLVNFAKDKGISKIILDSPSAFTRAHSFYKKVGFIEVKKEELSIEYDYSDRNAPLLFLLEIQ